MVPQKETSRRHRDGALRKATGDGLTDGDPDGNSTVPLKEILRFRTETQMVPQKEIPTATRDGAEEGD
jgi:hypothetical protein